MNFALFGSTIVFYSGFLLLFVLLPLATVYVSFVDDSEIDPDKMMALLPISIMLMFIGGVGMSTFG